MTLTEAIARAESLIARRTQLDKEIRDAKESVAELSPYVVGDKLAAAPSLAWGNTQKPMIIQKISVSFDGQFWTWHLSGKELRADGSIGLRHGNRHVRVVP